MEIHEALLSLDIGEEDPKVNTKVTHQAESLHGCHDNEGSMEKGPSKSGVSRNPAQAARRKILSYIARNCKFLLTCDFLPSIVLARDPSRKETGGTSTATKRRPRLYRRLSRVDQQELQDLTATLRRWSSKEFQTPSYLKQEKGNPEIKLSKLLAVVVEAMAAGQVSAALSIVQEAEKSTPPWRQTCLEKLLVCVSSPVPLEKFGPRMKAQELRTKVRISRPASTLIIVLRLRSTLQGLSKTIVDSSVPSNGTSGGRMFSDLGGAGPEATALVHSAFIALYRDAINLVVSERSACATSDNSESTTLDPGHRRTQRNGQERLIVLLDLLQNMSLMFTPAFLQRSAAETETRGVEECSSHQIPEVKAANNTGPRVATSTGSNAGPSYRLPSMGGFPMLRPANGDGALSAISTAIPVLGGVLACEGDVLGSASVGVCERIPTISLIHNMAWHTLENIVTHLSTIVPMASRASVSRKNSVLRKSLNSHGDRVESFTSKVPVSCSGAGSSMAAPESMTAAFNVLLTEVSRAQQTLRHLKETKKRQDQALREAGGQSLLTVPVQIPFSGPSAFPGTLGDGRKDGFAISFWMWVPIGSILPPQDREFEELPTTNMRRDGSTKTDPSAVDLSGGRATYSRRRVCYRFRNANPLDLKEDCNDSGIGSEGSGVFLVHEPSETNTQSIHVEFVVVRENRHENRVNESEPACGPTVLGMDTGNPSRMTAAKSGEGRQRLSRRARSSDYTRERLLSELPTQQWVHVCCMHSFPAVQTDSDPNGSVSEMTIAINGEIKEQRLLPAARSDEVNVEAHLQLPIRSELRVGDEKKKKQRAVVALADSDTTRIEGKSPWVCDLLWHPQEISLAQAAAMAESGVPSQLQERHRAANCYATRLSILIHTLATSSRRARTVLSTPQWVVQWLNLIPVCCQRAQSVIVRLLRHLLCCPVSKSPTVDCTNQPTGGPVSTTLSTRVVVHHLCLLIGKSCFPVCTSDKVTCLGYDVADTFAPTCHRHFSLESELVLLMRALVHCPTMRWKDPIYGALAKGLHSIQAKIPREVPCPIVDEKYFDHKNPTQHITYGPGAAAAAVYLAGGHIDGPRIGARVLVFPEAGDASIGALSDIGKTARVKEAIHNRVPANYKQREQNRGVAKCPCRGTVVGILRGNGASQYIAHSSLPKMKDHTSALGGLLVAVDPEYESCIDLPSGKNTSALSRGPGGTRRMCGALVIVVEAHKVVLETEIGEPNAQFLLSGEFIPVIQDLIGFPASLSSHGRSASVTDDEGSNTPPGQNLSEEDIIMKLVNAHLRCRLMRAISVQSKWSDQAVAATEGGLIPPLLALAATDLSSIMSVVLGSDVAVATQQLPALTILGGILERCSERAGCTAELQAAGRIVWERIKSGGGLGVERKESVLPGDQDEEGRWCGQSGILPRQIPVLQVLGGEVVVEGFLVRAASHFPSIRLAGVGVGLGSCGGRWYYEVTLLTDGLMQLGWAGPLFQCSAVRGQGVGDHVHSWGFDGFRQKKWCVSSVPYGERWRVGDVIGVLLDVDLLEMRFSINGNDMGVAFVGFPVEGIHPAASLNVGQAALFNFGNSRFLHPPSSTDGLFFQPIIDACCPRPAPSLGAQVPRNGQRNHSGLDTSNGQRLQDGRERNLGSRSTDISNGCAGEDGGRGVSSDDGSSRRGEMEDNSEDTELRRQGLVENLVGMGFPIEWAVRAAEQSDASMNEGVALAWIIEQMEAENAKIEVEVESMNIDGGDEVGEEYSPANGVRASESRDEHVVRDTTGDRRRDQDTSGRSEAGWRGWSDLYRASRRGYCSGVDQEVPTTACGILNHPQACGRDDVTHSLQEACLMAGEEELFALSFVLDTALPVLFARATISNLMSHAVSPVLKQRARYLPWVGRNIDLNLSYCSDPGDLSSTRRAADDSRKAEDLGKATSEVHKIFLGVLRALVAPACQMHLLDLIKLAILWYASKPQNPLETALESAITSKPTMSEGDNHIPMLPLPLVPPSTRDFDIRSYMVISDALDVGLHPRCLIQAMRVLLELCVCPIAVLRSTGDRSCTTDANASRVDRVKDGGLDTRPDPVNVAPEWLAALSCFVSTLVDKAAAQFEEALGLENDCSSLTWAVWVLETLMALATERGGKSRASSIGGPSDNLDGGDNNGHQTDGAILQPLAAIADAAGSAMSLGTFSTIIQASTSAVASFKVRQLAYRTCAAIQQSRWVTSQRHGATDSGALLTNRVRAHVLPQRKNRDYACFESIEGTLARSFAIQLRHERSIENSFSPLLHSLLEVLGGWQCCQDNLKGEGELWHGTEPRQGVNVEGQHGINYDLLDFDYHPALWVAPPAHGSGCATRDETRAATPVKPGHASSKRPGTSGSDASCFSNRSDSSTAPPTCLLCVEETTPTTVTLSWGGWSGLYPKGSNAEQNDISGHYPGGCRWARKKALSERGINVKLAGLGRIRAPSERGWVLKVSNSGLWGSDPDSLVASDLEPRGCFTIRGLAADTRYAFRLEYFPPRDPISPHPRTVSRDGDSGDTTDAWVDNRPKQDTVKATEKGDDDVSHRLLHGCDSEEGCDDRTEESSGAGTIPGVSIAVSGSEGDGHTESGVTHGVRSVTSSLCGVAEPGEFEACIEDIDDGTSGEEGGIWSCAAQGHTSAVPSVTFVATPSEVPFMLDPEGRGQNLRLSNSNLTVTNEVNKKWNAIRATTGFSTGVHSWKIHVDRCVSKNIFVGVVSAESSLDNYVGSDRSGWGYLANKAIWHNKSKTRSYGELFREGDTIGVHLDMDIGTLWFTRNGRDLGVAMQGLTGELYPAVSMYNTNDQLTLIPPEEDTESSCGVQRQNSFSAPHQCTDISAAPEAPIRAPQGTFTAECVVRRAGRAMEVLRALTAPRKSTIKREGFDLVLPSHLLGLVRLYLKRWALGKSMSVVQSSHPSAPVQIDTSASACQPFFGLRTGDRIASSGGVATVLGAARHCLWYVLLPAEAAGAWSYEAKQSSPTNGLKADKGGEVDAGKTPFSAATSTLAVQVPGDQATRAPIARFAKFSNLKVRAWSRRVVAEMISCPEEYVISHRVPKIRTEAPQPKEGSVHINFSQDKGEGHGEDQESNGVLALSLEDLSVMFEKWTPAMDSDLCDHLGDLAESLGVDPLQLPY
ncbi:unnamed protein product, partial [Discosporangium mesarthrocarpum]